jgi:hypothetical protein
MQIQSKLLEERKENKWRERERESNEEARVGGDNFNLQYYHTHT